MASKWPMRPIGYGASVYSGFAFKSEDFGDAGIQVVKIKNVNNRVVDLTDTTYLPTTKLTAKHSKFFLEDRDVLIAMTGQGSVGRVGRISLDKNKKALLNQRVGKFTTITDKLDIAYLFYVISTPHYEQILFDAGSGSGQPNLSPQTICSVEIPFPPIEIQRAIAHILGTLDDKIELNRRMNETLEAMARALFKAWFVDFEPVRAKLEGRWRRGQSLPGLPAHLYDLFPDRLVESKLGEIPEGWETGILGNVLEHPRRSKRPEEIAPETPYIALEHMPKRCIALAEWGAANGLESTKYEFKRGEILFGKLRPYFHKVGVAPIDGVCSTDIVVLAPMSPAWYGFVLAHVSSDMFVEYTNAGSTGTKMPRTNWSEMSRYIIVLPPEKVAATFNRYTQPMSDEIIVKIHKSKFLARLRNTLLPKLISGDLRIDLMKK